MNGGDWEFIVFLAVASLLNLWFLFRSFRAYRKREGASKAKAAAVLTLALADLCWSLPCLIQCAGNLALSRYWGSASGCDIQGFYATFTSFSTMLLTPNLAFLAHTELKHGKSSSPSVRRVFATAVLAFVLAAVLAGIPFYSTSEYVYLNAGFCYLDWYDNLLAGVWLSMFIPSQLAMCYWSIKIFRHKNSTTQPSETAGRGCFPSIGISYLCFAAFFLLCYASGIPLLTYGFLEKSFPNHLVTISGILAHGAEVFNPFLYGFLYLGWFNDDSKGETYGSA